jgi:hypothetical protein
LPSDDSLALLTFDRFEGVPRIHVGPVGCGRDVINGGSQLRREFASRYGIRAFDSEFDQVLESIKGESKIHPFQLV